MFLGTVEPRKNILSLIDAFKKFSELSTINYELLIAGARGWKCESIMKAIDETEGVRYIGYVDPEDKSALYELADLFVYPSLYEGFGFPVLEAFVSSTPVVTSNRSSLPEVSDGAAYLVNPYNVSEIQNGMRLILSDHTFQQRLSVMGKERVGEFSWDVAAKKFLEIIR